MIVLTRINLPLTRSLRTGAAFLICSWALSAQTQDYNLDNFPSKNQIFRSQRLLRRYKGILRHSISKEKRITS